jgi:hypothetical protein
MYEQCWRAELSKKLERHTLTPRHPPIASISDRHIALPLLPSIRFSNSRRISTLIVLNVDPPKVP